MRGERGVSGNTSGLRFDPQTLAGGAVGESNAERVGDEGGVPVVMQIAIGFHELIPKDVDHARPKDRTNEGNEEIISRQRTAPFKSK